MVEGKTYENGCDILATGGTWELMGNEMAGVASTRTAPSEARRTRAVLPVGSIVWCHGCRWAAEFMRSQTGQAGKAKTGLPRDEEKAMEEKDGTK